MTSRDEVTTKYAKAYEKSSKKDKCPVLDDVVSVTGWSRATPAGDWSRPRNIHLVRAAR